MTAGVKVDKICNGLVRCEKVVNVPPTEEKTNRSDLKVPRVMIKTCQYFTEFHTSGAAREAVRVQHPVAVTRWPH